MYTARLEPVAAGTDWVQYIEIKDGDTGEPIQFGNAEITITIKKPDRPGVEVSGDTTSREVNVMAPGLIGVEFLADRLKCLTIGDHVVGMTVKDSGYTTSLVVGTLPIVDGAIAL